MKAYRLGHRAGLDCLELVEVPPRRLGTNDVRVRIRAVSLNYRDLLVARQASAGELSHPIVPASDAAGEVVEVGDAVTRTAVGTRVAISFFPTWSDGPLSEAHHAAALGGSIDGVMSAEVVTSEDAIVAIPDYLSFEEAATLPCAGVTAWNALFEAACLGPGDGVLIQGTGGVSLFALQLARAAGATVIVTSGSPAKFSRLREMGAGEVIDYRELPAWGSEVQRLTGGRGVDLVVEVGGSGTFDQSVAALCFNGAMSLLGVLAGAGGPINTRAIFRKAIRVNGIYVGSRRMFESLNRALVATRLRPVVDRVFEFGEVRQAYEYLASGQHFGKVVVRVQ
jgi:NADPH:quinone reductase-like Zn-dependent oxidoreductase